MLMVGSRNRLRLRRLRTLPTYNVSGFSATWPLIRKFGTGSRVPGRGPRDNSSWKPKPRGAGGGVADTPGGHQGAPGGRDGVIDVVRDEGMPAHIEDGYWQEVRCRIVGDRMTDDCLQGKHKECAGVAYRRATPCC